MKSARSIIFLLLFLPSFLSNPPRSFSTEADIEADLEALFGQHYYGVYLLKNKVGYARSLLERTDWRGEEAFRVDFHIHYQLSLLGEAQKMTSEEERIYLPQKGLAAFKSRTDSVMGRVTLEGIREGNGFRVTTAAGSKLVEAEPETLRDYLADLILVKGGAGVGEEIRSVQFQPALLKSVHIVHSIQKIEKRFLAGIPIDIYHIRSDFQELGVTTVSLIDENLHTLEASVGNLLTIREEGEEEAKNLDYSSDVLILTAVTPDRPIPHPRRVRSLSLKIKGLENPVLLPLSSRQRLEPAGPESYYLKIERQDYQPAEPFPKPAPEEKLQPYLQPTVFIQSDHPDIQKRARLIAGDEENPYYIVEKLVHWVYGYLDKSFLAALPTALDILEKKSGDCKAHSILFIALSRSLGIPARRATGLVYTPDGKFYYHQWAEAYLGRWLPVDPVFDQVNADATHIKLSHGDLIEQIKLIGIIGNISIRVLESETETEESDSNGHRF